MNIFQHLTASLITAIFFLQAFAPAVCFSEQSLKGLRQGRVHIHTQAADDFLKISYTPIYGWDEPILLYGPDGRLIEKAYFGHDKPGVFHIDLDNGPGLYELILKSSYLWHVSAAKGSLVYEPPVETAGLRISFNETPLFFKVPEETDHFILSWINHRDFKGAPARIQLFSPNNELIADEQAPAVDPETGCRILGYDPSDCKGGDFNPERDPFPPHQIHINAPSPGVWKVVMGSTRYFFPDNVGIWLEGIPSFFSQNPNSVFIPTTERDPVSAEIRMLDKQLTKPRIGVVGGFGEPGGPRENIMTAHGIRAEKIFLNHKLQAPVNHDANFDPDNDPFDFKHHWIKLWPRQEDLFSLIVLNRQADWMRDLTAQDRYRKWGEWACAASEYMITERMLHPDQITVQIYNEPNMKMPLEDYLGLLKEAGRCIKSNPATKHIPIAAPAITTAMSRYDGDNRHFLNTEWIRKVLKEAGDIVDVVVFNVYGAIELEDTFLYAELVDQVDQLISEANQGDGPKKPIIIGATNRQGGLAPPSLFNSWEGGLWWASVLSQVINTGRVDAIHHFSLIDAGIRQKGLFSEDRQPKYQALVQSLYTRALTSGNLYRTVSDHEGLEAVSIINGQSIILLFVNKSRYPLETTIHLPFDVLWQIKQADTYTGFKSTRKNPSADPPVIIIPAHTVTWLELQPAEHPQYDSRQETVDERF